MLRDKRYVTRSIQSEMPGTSPTDNVNRTSLDSGQAEATNQLPPSKFLAQSIIGNSLGNEQFKELSNTKKSPSDLLFNDENNGRHNIMRKFDCYNHTLENGEMVLLPQANLHQSYQQQHQDDTVLLSGTSNNQEPIEDYFHHSLSSSCCCSHVYSQNASSFGNATQRRPEFCETIMKSSCSGTISTSITSSSSISISSSNGGNISNSMSNHVLQGDSISKSTNEFLNLAPNSMGSMETCGGIYCDCPMSTCQDIYCDGSICSCQNINCDSPMSACQDVHYSSSMNICCRDMSCPSFSPQNLKCQGQMMLPKSNTYERNSYQSHQPLSNVNPSKAQTNRHWEKRTFQTPKAPNSFIYDLSYNNASEQMDNCMAVKSEDNKNLLCSDKNQIWQYTTCHQTFPSIKHPNKSPNCCSFQNSPSSMLKVEKSKMWNCAHQPLSENFVFQEQVCKACTPTMEPQEINSSMPPVNYLRANMKSRNMLNYERPVNNMICTSSADLVPSQHYMHNGQPFYNSAATTSSTSTIITTSTNALTATTYITAITTNTTATTTAASSNSFSFHCCSSCSVQPLNYKLFPSSECSTPEVAESKTSLQYDQHSVISFMFSDSERDNVTWPANEVKEEMEKLDSSGRSLPSPPVFKNVSEALHRLPESPKVPLVCMEDVVIIDSSPGSDNSSNDTPNNANILNSSVISPTPQQQSFKSKTTTNPKSVKKLSFNEEKSENQFSKNSKESSKNHGSQEIKKENPANSTSKNLTSRSNQKSSIVNNKPNPVFSRSNRIRSPSIRYKDDVLSFPLVFPSRSSQSASNRVSETVKKSRVTNRRRQSDLEKVEEKSPEKPDETVTSKNLKCQTKHTPDTKATSLPLDRRKMLRSSNKVEDKSPVKLEKDTKVDDKSPVENKEVVSKQEQDDRLQFKQPENLLNKISPSIQSEDKSDKCHQTKAPPPMAVTQSHTVNKPFSFEDGENILHTSTASACHITTEGKHNSQNTATTSFTTSKQTNPSTSSITANFSSINTVTMIRAPLPLSILSRPEKAISECKKNSAFVSSELDKYLAGEAETINSDVDLSFPRNKGIPPKSGPFLPAKLTPFCDKTYAFEGNEKSNEKTLQKTTGIVYNTRSKCSSFVANYDSDQIVDNLHVDVFEVNNDANGKIDNVTNIKRDNNVNENTETIINDNPDHVTNDNSNNVTNKITVNFTNNNNCSVTNDYNDNVSNDNTNNVTNNYTDNVCNDNIDVDNVKDNVNNSVNNNNAYNNYNRETNHNSGRAKSLLVPCNSSMNDSVNACLNENKAGNSFSPVCHNHPIVSMTVSKKGSANNLAESSQSKSYSSGTSSLYEPDFDEVDGILFMSFPSEESLQAHIAVERNDKWESTAGHMSSISNILNFHRWKETHQEAKFPRPAFDKNMNLRGLHMRLKRYCKLLRSEWLKIKQKNLSRNNHRKAFKLSRFQMATRSKRWTRTSSAFCAGRSITSRNKNAGKFQKLHWRTEARLLRGLRPEEVRQMGMKKKRRKKFIFTHRKGCKRQDASGNEDSDSSSSNDSMEGGDAVSHTSVIKEAKEEKFRRNGYIHPMRSCCKKDKVVSVDEKMSKAIKSSKSHSDEEKPVIEKSAHLLYQSDEMHAIRKLGEFELNEPSIRKRTRSQVEYFKDQQAKNQRPNNSLPLTTFTQSMAQAATSALHDNFIRKNGSAAKSAAFSDGKHDTDMFTQVDSVMDEKRRLEEASQLIPLGGCKGYKDKNPSQAPAVRLCNTSEEELDKETERILLARQKLKAKNEKCNKPGCRYGCICHLCWISENYEELTKTCAISTKACDKEYCRLGCICDNNENTKLKVDCAKSCCELTYFCDSPHKNLRTKFNKSSPPKNLDCNTTKSPMTPPVSNECVDENSCSCVQDKGKLTSVDDTSPDKDGTSLNKGGTSLNKGGAALNKDGAALNKDGAALNKDGAALNKDGAALNKDGAALNKDGAALNKDGASVDKDGASVDKDGTLMNKDGASANKVNASVNKGGTPENKDSTVVNKGGTPVNKGGASANKVNASLNKGGTSANKDGALANKDGAPANKDGTSADKDGTSANKGGTLLNKEDTNCNKSKLPKKDKYASLPRRQMTHRTAKNLDAISRKAMMFYETSEMYHLKKKRNQSSLHSHVAGSRRRFSCKSTKSVRGKASGSEKENSKSSTSFKRMYSLRGGSNRHLSTENSEKSSEHSGHTSDPYAYPGQSIENCVVEIDQVGGNKHCKQFGVVTRKMVPKEDTENYNVWNKRSEQVAKETGRAKRLRMTYRKPIYHKSWSLRSKTVKLLDTRSQSTRKKTQQRKEEAYSPQSAWPLRSKERLTVKKEPVRELPARRCYTRLPEAGNGIDNLQYINDSENSSATSVPKDLYLEADCYEDIIIADDEEFLDISNSSITKDRRNSRRFRNDIQRSLHMSRERERRHQILNKMTMLQLVVYEDDPENIKKILPKQVILDTAIELLHTLRTNEDTIVSLKSSLYTKNNSLWEKLSKVKGELYETGYIESEINKILDDAGLPFDMYKPPVLSVTQTYEDMGSPLKFVPSTHLSTFECQIVSDEDSDVDVVSVTSTLPQNKILTAQFHPSAPPNCNEPVSNDNNEDVIVLAPQPDPEEKTPDVDSNSSTLMIGSVYSLAPEKYENFSTSYNIADDPPYIQLD